MKNKLASFFLFIGILNTLDILFFKFRNLTVENVLFSYTLFLLIKFIPFEKHKLASFFLFIGILDTLDILFFKFRNLTIGNALFSYILFLIFRFIPFRKIFNSVFNIEHLEKYLFVKNDTDKFH